MPDSYVEKLVESIKSKIRPGEKIVIETSNETMHLDLETGEMVSDSYANETWNFTPEGNVG